MAEGVELSDEELAALDAAFTRLPTEYPAFESHVRALNLAFKERLGKALEPRLINHMDSTQPKSLREYQKNATYVDQLLTELGLCASRGTKPALLTGNLALRSEPTSFRYEMMTLDEEDKTPHFEGARVTMPSLRLAPLTPEADKYLNRVRRATHRSRER